MRILLICSSLLLALCGGFAASLAHAQEPQTSRSRLGINRAETTEFSNDADVDKLSAAYYFNRANYAISREMYAEAMGEIDRGMDIDPGFLPFITQKALVLSRLSRHEEAARFYSLALEARPNDAQLAMMAAENLQSRFKGNSAALSNDLVGFFRGLSGQVTPELLKILAERQEQNAALFVPALRAASAAGKLTDEQQAVLAACLANNGVGAAALLRSQNNWPNGSQPLRAVFGAMTARALQMAGKQNEADAFYHLAAEQGFNQEALNSIKAQAYLRLNDPNKAAEVYEQSWRMASNPQVWAVQAADAFAAAGNIASASAILEKAAKIAPHDYYLMGQLYYRLAQAGKSKELKVLEQDLAARGNGISANFGRFLFARESQNRQEMAKFRQAVVEHVYDVSAVHYQNDIRLIIASLGFGGTQAPQKEQADLMRFKGWDLWDSGKIDDAYVSWRDSIALDPLHGQMAGPSMSVALLRQGRISDAMELFRLQYPKLPMFSFALYLLKEKQWSAAYPLLLSMPAPTGAEAPWYALALASGSLEGGDRSAVENSARALLDLDPPQKSLTADIPVADAVSEPLVLNSTLYQALFAEYLGKLLGQQNTALIPTVLASRQLQSMPARQAATLLSEAGFTLVVGDSAEAAVPLWQRALALNPKLPDAYLGMALASAMHGDMAAAETYLKSAPVSLTPAQEFALGRINVLAGQNNEAVRHFDNYLRRDPNNLAARYAVFNQYMAMFDYKRARALYGEFKHAEGPNARLYEGQCALALGDYARAEAIFRTLIGVTTRPVTPLLVAALRAQNRWDEATALLEQSGQPDPEKLAFLRRQAEAALEQRRYSDVRGFVQAYQAIDPDSAYMESLYSISLRDQYRMQADRLERLKREQGKIASGALDPAQLDPQEKDMLAELGSGGDSGLTPDGTLLDKAQANADAVLARNNIQRNALESLVDIFQLRHDFAGTAQISRRQAQEYPYDLHYQLQSAVHAGGVSRFDRALPVVQSLSALGPNGAGMALCFANVMSRSDGKGYTAQDVANYLDKLDANFHLVSLPQFLTPAPRDAATSALGKIPMLLVIGQTQPETLKAIDAALAQRGGKAVLLVSEQSFIPGTPDGLPNAALLRKLVESGRWDLALTDTTGRTMMDATGRRVGFWARRGLVDGRPETVEEMKKRWAGAMTEARQLAQEQGLAVTAWMYPGGDYGQISLNADAEVRQAYTEAARQVFATAFVPTANGYHTNSLDPMFVPVRNVYTQLDAKTLDSLSQRHPTRLAVQTEGILASWHGQLPRAQMLLERAAGLGLSPAANTSYRASAALFDGDAPYANELAREAKQLDPDNPNADKLLERTQRLLHPRVSFVPRGWVDNADRKFTEYEIKGSTYLQENLSIEASASNLWWKSNDNSIHGNALGLGVRYFPFKQHWLDLMVRGVQPDSGPSFLEARAAWRGVYSLDTLRINGPYTLTYNRQSIETAESIKKGVYADRLGLNTQARILDWGLLQAEVFGTQRTDGNRTLGGSVSPRYIVWDKPQLQVGYLFSTANSDRKPADYYAPQEYVNHMAVASFDVALLDQMHVRGFAGYGTAISKNKNWENVLRYSLDLSWVPTDNWSLGLGYRRLELPDYNMDEYSLNLQYVF